MLGAVPAPAALEVAESGRKSCFSARSIARFSVRRPRAFIEAAVVSGWASDFKSCTCGASGNIKLMRELYASWSASEDPARCHTSTLLPHIMVALGLRWTHLILVRVHVALASRLLQVHLR